MRRAAAAALIALSACGARTNLGDESFESSGAGGRVTVGSGTTPGCPVDDCGPCGVPSLELQLIGNAGLELDAADRVAAWYSPTPSGYATQDAPFSRPTATTHDLNGIDVIHFDGTDDHLVLPSGFADFSAGLTAFVLAQSEAIVDIHAARFFDLATRYGSLDDSILFVRFGAGGNELMYQTYVADLVGPYVTAPDQVEDDHWHLYAVVAQCGAAEARRFATLYRDGITIARDVVLVPRVLTRNSNFIARSNLAQDSFFRGSIAEIQIWRGVMSDAQRTATEQTLRKAWGNWE